MKNNVNLKRYAGLLILVTAGVLSLGLGLSLRPWLTERYASAAELPLPQVTVVTLPALAEEMGTSVRDASALTKDTRLIQKTNGILVTIDNFRRENNKFLLDVCYDFPTNLDWTIWDAHLDDGVSGSIAWDKADPIIIREPPVDGKQRVTPFERTQVGIKVGEPRWEDASDTTMGLRCDTLYFDGVSEVSTHLTFTLDAIAAYPKEGEECDPAYLAKYQAALDARNTGIKVDCRHEEYMSGVEVLDKPASMSLEEAENILHGNDLFLDIRGIRGPWVFVFELK